MSDTIGVDESNDLSGGLPHADVSGVARVLALAILEHPYPGKLPANQVGRVISPAMDNDHLVRRIALLLDRAEASLNRWARAISCYDYGNTRHFRYFITHPAG